MFKLLGAYFSRLSKWLIFRILLLLMLIGGIGGALLMRKIPGAWNMPYMMAYLMFPHYVGVIIGLFNYPLFTNGTIRNQLSVFCIFILADIEDLILKGRMRGVQDLQHGVDDFGADAVAAEYSNLFHWAVPPCRR